MNTVKIAKPTLEKRRVEQFFKDFKNGKYGSQRKGQAFYNEFNLHRIDDQASLQNLYAKDGEHARNLIYQIFDIQ